MDPERKAFTDRLAAEMAGCSDHLLKLACHGASFGLGNLNIATGRPAEGHPFAAAVIVVCGPMSADDLMRLADYVHRFNQDVNLGGELQVYRDEKNSESEP